MAEASLPQDELRAALARARAAFPGLPLDDATFARRLADAVGDAQPGAITALAVEDLFLACAAGAGTPGAAATFTARHGDTIRGAVARVVRGADAAEVEQ